MSTTNQSNSASQPGVIGFFEKPDALVSAARQVREARYQFFDTFTPYPIHGMDEAMGLKRSPIPFITAIAGMTGLGLAFTLEYWIAAVDWPLNVGGKPFNSWPAFVPVMFELTVLLAGLSTAAAMIIFCNLPNTKRRAYDPSLTNDQFALVIEPPPFVDETDEDNEKALRKMKSFKKFDVNEATELLRKLGAKNVRTVTNEGWF